MTLFRDWSRRIRLEIDGLRTRLHRRIAPVAAADDRLRRRIDERIRRLGRAYEDGNSNLMGYTYHPIYFEGYSSIPVHRDACESRLRAILDDLQPARGDLVLDIGANVGYFAFGLAARGAIVEAYEPESDTFEIGAALARLNRADVIYINRAMSTDALRLLRERYRAILLLSTFHWIVKQEGEEAAAMVLRDLARRTDILYFEVPCNVDDAMFKHRWFASPRSTQAFLRDILPQARVTALHVDAAWMERVLWRIDSAAARPVRDA